MRVLALGLLIAFVVLAVSACGGSGELEGGARARTIPEVPIETEGRPLAAGEYVSDEFRPAMSFRLGEGWWTGIERPDSPGHSHRALPAHGDFVEMRDNLTLFYNSAGRPVGTLDFFVDPRVYRIVNSYDAEEEPTPEDIAAWLRRHPYLDTGQPEPATVGAGKGVRFDAAPSRVPEEYVTCVEQQPCLPLFQTEHPDLFYALARTDRVRFLVLDDVEGETVTIAIKAGSDEFDEFLPRAQQVLESVEWKGA